VTSRLVASLMACALAASIAAVVSSGSARAAPPAQNDSDPASEPESDDPRALGCEEHATLAQCIARCTKGGPHCDALGKRICAEGSVDECQVACDGGNAHACYALAQIYSAGTRAHPDAARVGSLLERACDAGDVTACWHLGIGRLCGTFATRARTSTGIDSLERACSLSRAGQPGMGGPDCSYRPATTAKLEEVMWLGQDSVAGGDACDVLARLAPKRAAPVFERFCAASPEADDERPLEPCGRLADLAPGSALPLLSARCAKDSVDACALVVALADKLPRAVDAGTKRAALRRLCDAYAERRESSQVDYCGRLKDMRGSSP